MCKPSPSRSYLEKAAAQERQALVKDIEWLRKTAREYAIRLRDDGESNKAAEIIRRLETVDSA